MKLNRLFKTFPHFKCTWLVSFCAFSILVDAQVSKTIYIDPTYSGTSTGTINQPFVELPKLESENTYLIKGGTVYKPTTNIFGEVDNCKISSYGTGRATIRFHKDIYSRLLNLKGNGNTVENINLVSDNHIDYITETEDTVIYNHKAASVLEFYVNGGSSYVKNVSIKGGHRPFVGSHYAIKTGNIYIDGLTIDSCQHDGIYVTFLDSFMIKNSTITNTNLGWFSDYGGDAIQLGDVNHVVVDSCNLDHSSTPGKYSMIAVKYFDCLIKNTYFKSDSGEACLFPGNLDSIGNLCTISNCIFEGGIRCIQNRTQNLIINNCLFKPGDHTTIAIDANNNSQISNCTFANFTNDLMACYNKPGVLVCQINNCLFYNNSKPLLLNTGNVSGTNNDFYNTPINGKELFTGTLNIDPVFLDASSNLITDTTLIRLNIGYNPGSHITGPNDIRSYENVLRFNMFPNPNTGTLFNLVFENSNYAANEIKIYDFAGRLVFQNELPVGEKTYQINSNLSKGAYMLIVSGNDFYGAQKFIVL